MTRMRGAASAVLCCVVSQVVKGAIDPDVAGAKAHEEGASPAKGVAIRENPSFGSELRGIIRPELVVESVGEPDADGWIQLSKSASSSVANWREWPRTKDGGWMPTSIQGQDVLERKR